ncbi:uncharacterized protein [Spinacia oleracea]|uniref:Retrotransposon gag domain-containing protein n=1 Tax=Spinacia oleracea TaxID=3562 RepID=A0A9R0KAI3_SPIOL|nr:uncharacterized protein LOC110802559 [Spinacia oleracea]
MTGELMSVIQGPQESLREYISRFNMEASNIPKLQQEVAVLAMMTGLRDGEFKSYLGRKSFTTLAEVLGKANKFIKSEEIGRATSRRYVASENNYGSQSKKEPYKKEYPDRRENPQPRRDWQGPGRGKGNEFKTEKRGKFSEYTPLVASRTQIFAISKEDEKWQRPPKMYDKYRDPKKYCDFHRDHGHLTEECTHLKDNIEDLIRRGYLTQFKAKSSYSRTYENRDNDNRSDNKKAEPKQSYPADQKRMGDILVITGGPVYAGTTVSGAKASVSEFKHQVNYHNSGKWPAPPKIPQCTFTEEDYGGSSANILFWPAFQELQIDEKYVKPVNYPVIGFTGATVIPEGIVSLPVQIGQGKDIKDIMVDFMIVKFPAAYNVILGRPFIHDAGTVVSTYHLTMMYTTNDGRSAKVKGSQEQAKKCYHTALKQPPRPHHWQKKNFPNLEKEREQSAKKTSC